MIEQRNTNDSVKVVGMTINESNSRLNFKMINISLNPEFQEKLESKNRSILKELQNEDLAKIRLPLFSKIKQRDILSPKSTREKNNGYEEKSIILSPFSNTPYRADECCSSKISESEKDKENISAITSPLIQKPSKISKKLDRVITSKFMARQDLFQTKIDKKSKLSSSLLSSRIKNIHNDSQFGIKAHDRTGNFEVNSHKELNIEIDDQVSCSKTAIVHPQSTKSKSNYVMLSGSENFKTVKGGIVESRIKEYKLETQNKLEKRKQTKHNQSTDFQMQIYRSCSHLYKNNDCPENNKKPPLLKINSSPEKNKYRRAKALSNSSTYGAEDSEVKVSRKRIFSQKSIGGKSSSNSSISSRQNSCSSVTKEHTCMIDCISCDDLKNIDKLNLIEEKIHKAYEFICSNISDNTKAIHNGCSDELKHSLSKMWSDLKSDIQTISFVVVPYLKTDRIKKMCAMNITKQVTITKYIYVSTACLGMLVINGKQSVNQNLRTLFYNIYQNFIIFIEFALSINYKFINSSCPVEINQRLRECCS